MKVRTAISGIPVVEGGGSGKGRQRLVRQS